MLEDTTVQKWKTSNGFNYVIKRRCKNCMFYRKSFAFKPHGYCIKMWSDIYRREDLSYNPIHLKYLTRVNGKSYCDKFESSGEEER